MKTKKQIEAGLYKEAKLNHSIAIAMYIVFAIGILVDIIARIEGEENHFELSLKAIGMIFPLVFCCVLVYHFFFPSNLKKEKEDILKSLESLRSEKKNFEELALAEAQNQNPEKIYQQKFEATQQKIWKLEWKLKQIGG